MTNDQLEKIIENNQKLIAEKHKIGTSLVTGHRKSYFDESTKLAMIDFAIEQLEKLNDELCSNDITIVELMDKINELQKQKEEL